MAKTLTAVTVGPNTVLLIPESRDQFQYRGFLYVRDEFGRFVVRSTLEGA